MQKENKLVINRDQVTLTEEEKQFEKDFDAGLYTPVANFEERKQQLMEAAKSNIARRKRETDMDSTRMFIDRKKDHLNLINRGAEMAWMTYDDFIKSVVLQYVSDELKIQ